MKWEMVRMNELCDIVRGSSPRPKGDPRYYGGEVPRLMIEDLTRDGKFVIPKVDSLTKEGALLSRPMQKGDLVITVSGRPGVPAILNIDACIHDGFVGIRNLNKKVDSNFLYWFLLKSKGSTNDQSVGAIFKNLTTDQIKDLQIPLPHLATQKRIAAILDAADALRRKDQALLQKYDELAQGIFVDMFGDPVKNEKGWVLLSGENYCKKITVGLVIKPASYYVDKGVPALRSLNVRANKIVMKNLVFISEEIHGTTLSKSRLKLDDVVIVRSGQPGTSAVIEKHLGELNCIDLIIATPNKNVIEPKYLAYFYNSEGGKKIISSSQKGQIQKHFNVGDAQKQLIPVPPIELQVKFIALLSKIQSQKDNAINSLNHSETLFQSLLQKAFNAELVP